MTHPVKLSPLSAPLILNVAGLLLFVFGMPQVLEGGRLSGSGWLVPIGSAVLQALAVLWTALRLRALPKGSPRGRYFFYLAMQNLGLWPVVGLLVVLALK